MIYLILINVSVEQNILQNKWEPDRLGQFAKKLKNFEEQEQQNVLKFRTVMSLNLGFLFDYTTITSLNIFSQFAGRQKI